MKNISLQAEDSPISQLGDYWQLGLHRILCGDNTDQQQVNTLLQGELADLVFLDPPYNVNYQGHTLARWSLRGDNIDTLDYQHFLKQTFATCKAIMKPTASLYVCHGFKQQKEVQSALEANSFCIRSQLIWVKHHFVSNFGRYRYQHEPIFYAYLKGCRDSWYGDKRQSSVWSIAKPAANRLHPTMKPLALLKIVLSNSSQVGDCVVDLFGGAGATLIAAELLQRQARLMEIEPRYVDVMIRRWQTLTGQPAYLRTTQQTFVEVQQQRQMI